MNPESMVEQRVQNLVDWIRANKVQLSQTEKTELNISMSGQSIKGKITLYPKWGKE